MRRRTLQNAWIAISALAALAAPSVSHAGPWEGFLELLHLRGPSRDQPTFVSALGLIQQTPAIRALLAASGLNTLQPELDVNGQKLRTLKFKHFYRGLEVIGSQVFFHVGEHVDGPVRDLLARFDLAATPRLSARAAQRLAISYSGGTRALGSPALKILPGPSRRSARLIYTVQVAEADSLRDEDSVEVWLDALSGAHLATLPSRLSVSNVPVQVRSARAQGFKVEPHYSDDDSGAGKTLLSCRIQDLRGSAPSQVDGPACRELVRTSCQSVGEHGRPSAMVPASCLEAGSGDEAAERARAIGQAALDYFNDVHGRDGFDGQGSTLVTVVHAGDAFDNAFWSLNGHYMAYGDGDGETTGDYTRAKDIGAHELTHAVTQSTAHLISIGESGALNEAYSDYFGKVIENEGNWVLGRNTLIHPHDGEGIRDLEEPARLTGTFVDSAGEVRTRPYPARTAEMAPIVGPCSARNDFCGVHFNATIPGHAAQQIDRALGRDKAERLIYLTLTQFLAEGATFRDSAEATIAACARLLSEGDCSQVRGIYADAGML